MTDFAATLRWIDEAGLDPYESRLLLHYWRRGQCWESQRTIAEICQMSLGQVNKARKSLIDGGYIKEIVLANGRFAIELCSPHEQRSHSEQIQQLERSPHEHCSPYEQKPVVVVHGMNAILNNLEELNNLNNTDTPLPPKRHGLPQYEIPAALRGEDFETAFINWFAHCWERGRKLTQMSGDALLKDLAKIGRGRAIAAIEHSIKNNWLSVHEPEKKQDTNGRQNRRPPILSSSMQAAVNYGAMLQELQNE